jgi:hypothetical protein
MSDHTILALGGIVGAVVLLLGILVAAFSYSGAEGESYSPLNHTISELGETGVSEGARWFNLGLILGGLMLIVHMVFIMRAYGGQHALITAAGITGVIAAAGGMAVGFLPLGGRFGNAIHFLVAVIFFGFAALHILIFTIYLFFFDEVQLLPGWVRIVGVIAFAVQLAFFIWIAFTQQMSTYAGSAGAAFRWGPFLEWLSLVATVVWVLSISIASLNKA